VHDRFGTTLTSGSTRVDCDQAHRGADETVDARDERRYSHAVPRIAKQTWGYRLSPGEWPFLFRSLRETPDDVALGARIFFALGGHDEGPTYRRLVQTEEGAHLAQNRIGYPALFTDYDRLRALPEGTLGREYVDRLDERDIHPAGIIEATRPVYDDIDFSLDHEYTRDRLSDIHDLFHVLTGYGIDMHGEAGVAAFTFAQSGNKGWASLVFLHILIGFSARRVDGPKVIVNGYLRGRRARYILAENDWDRLLRLPIDDARAELGISPLEPYRPMDRSEAFASAAGQASPGSAHARA
jgi:ubiquinone biosynthesis protein COQ4